MLITACCDAVLKVPHISVRFPNAQLTFAIVVFVIRESTSLLRGKTIGFVVGTRFYDNAMCFSKQIYFAFCFPEILEKYGIDGIVFKDGEPVFDNVSKGTVTIEGFSSNRDDNFDKADIELAKQRRCSPEEVKQWRKENGYTWHECKDMATMQKVPSEIHNNITHRGGVSNSKSLEN